ncbi:hypothetical protein CA234_20815 [Sphingomonas sp. ABOLE]|uniref:PDDEXK-like family protein n=1 Tax=Sphingomonas sp. ABOLE TaxID=1985878 RepID=UPI000F7EA1BB|nr:PD-(D/E)XK nuclease family protein [Sphingomonas sp. ABOLE]RSV34694.1 hypothetical protein CA234_20815 [Sphingomonas sp. ABOLE]
MATAIEDSLSRLLDDKEFWVVRERVTRFNLFEAIGAVNGELRHSNFLAYVLSPGRPHGLGSKPLEALLRVVLESIQHDRRPLSTLELLVTDLDDAIVHRERDSIDLLIELDALNLVVVIENKIRARAGEGQLARYRDVVANRYPAARKLLIFLTPDGHGPDHPEYVAVSYMTLAGLLEDVIDHSAPSSATDLIIRHYVDMIRKNIVDDEHLRTLAGKLYERHAEALDYLFANRPRGAGLIETVEQQVRSCEGLVIDSTGASVLRFSPEEWDKGLQFRADSSSWSKTGRGLLFEVKTYPNKPGRVNVSLIIGPGPQDARHAIYEEAKGRPDLFVGLVKPMGAKWATIFSRDLLSAERATTMSAEQQANNLRLAWSDFQATTMPALIEAVSEIDGNVANRIGNAHLAK